MVGGLAQGLFESVILIAFVLEALEKVCRDEVECKYHWTVIQVIKRSMGSRFKKAHILEVVVAGHSLDSYLHIEEKD